MNDFNDWKNDLLKMKENFKNEKQDDSVLLLKTYKQFFKGELRDSVFFEKIENNTVFFSLKNSQESSLVLFYKESIKDEINKTFPLLKIKEIKFYVRNEL